MNSRSDFIRLNDVKMLFPNLKNTEIFDGKDTKKYTVLLVIDKESETGKKVKKLFDSFVISTKCEKLRADKLALKDGDNESFYPDSNPYNAQNRGKYLLRATSFNKPVLLDRKKNDITNSDLIGNEEFYPGAIVNAIVNFYLVSNQTKIICAGLNSMQSTGRGDRIGSGGSPLDIANSMYDELEDEEDEDLDFI